MSAQVDEAYLAAATAWIGARLDALVGAEGAAEALEAAEAALEAAGEATPRPAALALADRLGLSSFDLGVLLLCVAAEVDPRAAARCAELQSPERAYPSFAVALVALPGASWEALTPEAPLLRHRLVEALPQGPLPPTLCPLRLDPRIQAALRGLGGLDERLALALAPADDDDDDPTALPASHAAIVGEARAHLAAPSPPGIALVGPDPAALRRIAAAIAEAEGRALDRLALASAPTSPAELDLLARLWAREAALAPRCLLIEVEAGEPSTALARLVDRLPAPLLIASADAPPALASPVVALAAPRPTAAEQEAAWGARAGVSAAEAARLGAHFDLGLPAIARAAAFAESDPSDRPKIDRLWGACRALTRPRLGPLAARIEPRAGWDDLVLPAESLDLLHQVVDQIRLRGQVYEAWGFRERLGRGLGVTALFAGESGTGKTLAAEVIAGALELDLYRVDLSQVVDKYIGETEKNLRRLFDAADDGAAVLFFDEADALFGKRSEVRDSHDRHANIETSYLLQRLEGYRGLAILATNRKDAVDAAFLRRLRFVVAFPFPGPQERARIWRRVFPGACALDPAIDFDALAELGLTGGHIATAAVNAAFLAARDGGPVTMPAIVAAARAELRKLDQGDYGGPP
ncbi:MAG: ATP-binding protein [Nannocystaceae bacterium]